VSSTDENLAQRAILVQRRGTMREQTCLLCGRRDGLRRIATAEGDAFLCSEHAQQLSDHAADLASVLERLGIERRKGGDRRQGERRMFPRPEGRRLSRGRRATDPRA